LLTVAEYAWWIIGAILVAGAALRVFVVLLRRVRRGSLGKAQAAFMLLPTLLLPVPYVFVVGFLYGLANALGPGHSVWMGDAGVALVVTVLALFGGMGMLNVVFWIMLLRGASTAAE
jgi:hypothetical protein